MICPNCAMENDEKYKFCIKCGGTLQKEQVPINNIEVEPIQQNIGINPEINNVRENIGVQEVSFNSPAVEKVKETPISFIQYFFIMLAFILKPFTATKEELNKFNNIKNSAILSLIVCGAATVLKLLNSMLSVIRVKTLDWSSGDYKTTWVWENLKELNYIEIIAKNFFTYLGIIVAIAGIYYIAGLIIKKQLNFSKLVGISALSIIPMLLATLVLSPIGSLISFEVGMAITVIGIIYTVILIYEGINAELLLEGNIKYYFNLICMSIIGVAACYLIMKPFIDEIGELSDLLG